MKKLILLFGLMLIAALVWADCSSVLRLGSTDSETLMPGDEVYIPIYIDEVNEMVAGFTLGFYFDYNVISWNGSTTNPAPGISYINPDLTSLGSDWLWNYNSPGQLIFTWIEPTYNGVEFQPGDIIITLRFTYYGGETALTWDPDSQLCPTNNTLINGCICNPIPVPVTFHVTSGGGIFPLQGAHVIAGQYTLVTNEGGIAVFNFEDGTYNYSATKAGYSESAGVFTVAGEELYMDVNLEANWLVTFHAENFDSVMIQIPTTGDTLWTHDGFASVNLDDGYYMILVTYEYYDDYFDVIVVNGQPLYVNIPMVPSFYNVDFFINCCGEPVANYQFGYEGQNVITDAQGMADLVLIAGFYSFEIGGVPVTFTVPDTMYVPVDICSEVTFHITCDGMSIAGASVTVDNETYISNALGIVVFCLQNGIHDFTIYYYGFEPITGQFLVNNEPLLFLEDICINFPVPVQFQVTNDNCENFFDGLFIVCNGDTIQPGGTIELESGSYYFELILSGCGSLSNGIIEVISAPVIVVITVPWLPQVIFHVTDQFGDDFPGALINVDDDLLITDNSGLASFCTTGGLHPYWVANPGYDTIHNNFIFECADTTLTVILMTGSVKNERLTLLDIYPNPSTGKFCIENINLSIDPAEILVMDLTGRVVYESTLIAEKVEVDLTGQQKGMYFVRVKEGEEIVTRKLIIQ
jgi:hypothetical protein